MSRASNGTYTAPTNSWNPAIEGTAIDETDWNAILDDIETALTDSLSVSGKGKVTAHIDFDENASPGTPASNVGRLYAGDDSGLTTVYWKDASGNTYNLLQGAASGLTYQFDTSTTTTSDPGAGKIRFNNATLSSVTEIAIDDSTSAGADVSAFILTWDDAASSIKGTVFVQKRTSPSTIAIFNITGTSTDESGWTRLVVTYVTHNGSLAANDPISVAFAAAGTGTAGASGATGPNTGLDYAWDTGTTDANPGSGNLRVNNATLGSATFVYISKTDRLGNSQGINIDQWDASTNTTHLGTLRVFDVVTRTKGFTAEVTTAFTDGTSYWKIPLASIQVLSGGAPSASDVLAIMWSRTGNRGIDGAGTGDVSSSTNFTVDNRLIRSDRPTTDNKNVQSSPVSVDDTGNMSGVVALSTTTIELGHATDTTLARVSAGVVSVEGETVHTNSISRTVTASGIELGHATDTTITRTSAGAIAVEGVGVALNSASLPHTAGTIELGHASDTTFARVSAGIASIEGSVIQLAGVQEWFIPAASFAPRTTGGCATLATLETTTNRVNLPHLAFDATTQEFAQVQIPRMPKSWNEGTITAIPQWTHPSTTTNFGVVWGVSAVALSDGDAGDTAFGTAQTSTDTGGTTSTMYHGPATSAITIGNSPAEGDTVIIQVSRNPADASDTMAVDAFFLGLLIRVTTNAANDA